MKNSPLGICTQPQRVQRGVQHFYLYVRPSAPTTFHSWRCTFVSLHSLAFAAVLCYFKLYVTFHSHGSLMETNVLLFDHHVVKLCTVINTLAYNDEFYFSFSCLSQALMQTPETNTENWSSRLGLLTWPVEQFSPSYLLPETENFKNFRYRQVCWPLYKLRTRKHACRFTEVL